MSLCVLVLGFCAAMAFVDGYVEARRAGAGHASLRGRRRCIACLEVCQSLSNPQAGVWAHGPTIVSGRRSIPSLALYAAYLQPPASKCNMGRLQGIL